MTPVSNDISLTEAQTPERDRNVEVENCLRNSTSLGVNNDLSRRYEGNDP